MSRISRASSTPPRSRSAGRGRDSRRQEDGKAGIVVGVTPEFTARFRAVDRCAKVLEALGGKGGGGRARYGAGRRPRWLEG